MPDPIAAETSPLAPVAAHWNATPCGTRDLPPDDRRAFFAELERERYEWEPYIARFARFERGRGQRLLEIGVGAGTDFTQWVRAGAIATGVDLTPRGVELTRERLALEGLSADVRQANAEALPFADASFDHVYSWGVLHHAPDTPRAISEVHRVLRPGGTATIMIYHLRAWVPFTVWAVHGPGKGHPRLPMRRAIAEHLESPGTKAYTRAEARRLFQAFSFAHIETQLSHGDLLQIRPGPKYSSGAYRLLWRLYPRWLVRTLGHRFGTNLVIEARK
jgi:ubiquinone/menaquinone biosynthesis C-methylase UbiE